MLKISRLNNHGDAVTMQIITSTEQAIRIVMEDTRKRFKKNSYEMAILKGNKEMPLSKPLMVKELTARKEVKIVVHIVGQSITEHWLITK